MWASVEQLTFPTSMNATLTTAATSRRVFFLAAPLALLCLRIFPPGRYSIYPPCPIHQFTGLLCPGCGATRALAALTHLHFTEAWRLNPLLFLLLPLAIFYFTRPRKLHPLAVAALAAITILFTIARNI